MSTSTYEKKICKHSKNAWHSGHGVIGTVCSSVASENLSDTAEVCVQGDAPTQDRKKCSSKFHRIKKKVWQVDVRKLQWTAKEAAVSALFAVGFTEKENSRLAVQRIMGCSFVEIWFSQRKHIWKRNYCHRFCFMQYLSGQNGLMGISSAICQCQWCGSQDEEDPKLVLNRENPRFSKYKKQEKK